MDIYRLKKGEHIQITHIVGSFGTDVLEATLSEREKAFRDRESPRQLSVFCGYGGAEHTDPFLKAYTLLTNQPNKCLFNDRPIIWT